MIQKAVVEALTDLGVSVIGGAISTFACVILVDVSSNTCSNSVISWL